MMTAPPRPIITYEPAEADVRIEGASTIKQALDDLYEAAFCNHDRNHAMDQAHAAPAILANAIHELFQLRRVQVEAVGDNPQSPTSNPQSPAPRPPTTDELLGDIDTLREFYEDARDRLRRVASVANEAALLPNGEPIPSMAREYFALITRLASIDASPIVNRQSSISNPPSFPARVATELISARDKFPPLSNVHEAHSVILEELDEFWDEAKRRLRSPAKLAHELVQVAAMCQRACEDLRLLDALDPHLAALRGQDVCSASTARERESLVCDPALETT